MMVPIYTAVYLYFYPYHLVQEVEETKTSVCRSGLVQFLGPKIGNWQPQLVATSISNKQLKMVENCVFTHDFGGKSLVLYYVMHSEGVHTTKHDQIEQHTYKKNQKYM